MLLIHFVLDLAFTPHTKPFIYMLTTLPLILLTSPLFYCKNLLSSSPNPFFPSLNPAKYPLSFSVNTARSLTIHTHSPKRMKGKMAHKVVLFGLSCKQIHIDLLSLFASTPWFLLGGSFVSSSHSLLLMWLSVVFFSTCRIFVSNLYMYLLHVIIDHALFIHSSLY